MDQPKRRTGPSIGFVLLVFALVAGLSLGATAALPLGHSAASSGAGVASAPAAPTAKSVSGASHTSSAYPANAYLRVFNAVPSSTAFDIYLNGSIAISNLAYKSDSGYDALFPGVWGVTVYPTGSTPVAKNLTYSTTVTLNTSVYYTLALTGTITTVSSVFFNDTTPAFTANSFNVRFFNAGVNATPAITINATNPLSKTPALNFTLPSEVAGAIGTYHSELNASVNLTADFTKGGAVQVWYNNTMFLTNNYTIAFVGYSNNTTALGPALVILIDGATTGTPTTTHAPASSLSLTTTLTTYTVLPANFLFSFTVANASILTTNTFAYLNITDFATSKLCMSINLASMLYNVSPTKVYYYSVPTWGTVATEYFSLTLTSGMVVNTTSCPTFASDPAIVTITGNTTDPINGTTQSIASEQTSFVWLPVSSQLHVSSSPAAPTTFGIYANYSSQYVGRVALSVYNPTTGLVTFSASLLWVGGTPTTVTWIETTAGSYPYTLSVYTAFGVFNTTGTINVLPGSSTFYNSTTWTNSTLISGLSPAAAGTLLLIVGLLIGMIVAMVVGRMVWGGPKQVAPAQPWEQKPAAPNTCSVCGRSFNTPEELAAHSKSEHGMQ